MTHECRNCGQSIVKDRGQESRPNDLAIWKHTHGFYSCANGSFWDYATYDCRNSKEKQVQP